VYGVVLSILGFTILATCTNWITVLVGITGIVDYVIIYGYAKRKSIHGTFIGGVAGATAIVAGYTAVTSKFDLGALLLFLIMFIWQMPHFYAIAIYRARDYKNAGLPVMSVVKGIRLTQFLSLAYIALYVLASSSLTAFGFTGYTCLIVMLVMSLVWFWIGMLGLANDEPIRWGHKIFGFSLIILLIFSLLLSLENVLP
jgi:protoheme IX farnesyltransferase